MYIITMNTPGYLPETEPRIIDGSAKEAYLQMSGWVYDIIDTLSPDQQYIIDWNLEFVELSVDGREAYIWEITDMSKDPRKEEITVKILKDLYGRRAICDIYVKPVLNTYQSHTYKGKIGTCKYWNNVDRWSVCLVITDDWNQYINIGDISQVNYNVIYDVVHITVILQ